MFKKTFLKGVLLLMLSSLVFVDISAFATTAPSSQSTEIKTQVETENELISEAMATLSFLSQ